MFYTSIPLKGSYCLLPRVHQSLVSHLLRFIDRLPPWLNGKKICLQFRRHKICGFDPWVGKIPWRRKWQPLQYSCLKNPMDRGVWWAYSPWCYKESGITERLSMHGLPTAYLQCTCTTFSEGKIQVSGQCIIVKL